MTPLREKPFHPSSEENKQAILEAIAPRLATAKAVLEIGSGSGQHAVHFAQALSGLRWQCSDLPEQLPGIRLWLEEAQGANLPPPISLDMDDADWDKPLQGQGYDAVFSANTAHIMSLSQVERLFLGVGALLPAGGVFLLYGPFSCDGKHNSESNRRFDQSLRMRDPLSGVRDIRELERFAARSGLRLEAVIPMPVNNRTLVWRRTEDVDAINGAPE
jgi:cyclopropane fatty-acyl-phospholipid synthase-like methyltransferase